MRILHVVPSYLPAVRYGGPIHSVHGLARAQAMLGHRVAVYTTNVDGEGVSPVPLGASVAVDGVEVTYFAAAAGRRIYRAPAMADALRRELPNSDILHLHSVFLWPTTAAAAIARRIGVPYFLSPRGMLWREMIEQRSRLAKQVWIALFERRNVERAAAIHVTARIEADKLGELGFRLPPIFSLANGVDLPEAIDDAGIAADVRRAVGNGDYLLSLGRIHQKKNLAALLQAIAGEPRLRLVIAGNDEGGEAARLRTLIANLRIGDRVELLDRQIAGADKEFLFARAGLFVLPSRSENFGNTVLEAMVRGVPVLASDAAGAAEIVRTSGAGICCAPEPEAIREAIAGYADNPAAFAAMGNAGRQIAIKALGWPAIAREMIDAYRSASRACAIRYAAGSESATRRQK